MEFNNVTRQRKRMYAISEDELKRLKVFYTAKDLHEILYWEEAEEAANWFRDEMESEPGVIERLPSTMEQLTEDFLDGLVDEWAMDRLVNMVDVGVWYQYGVISALKLDDYTNFKTFNEAIRDAFNPTKRHAAGIIPSKYYFENGELKIKKTHKDEEDTMED